jgi:hypothetical protein
MSFDGYIKDLEKEISKILKKEHKDNNFWLVNPELSKMIIQAYSDYRTKQLVRATWILAICTIIMNIISTGVILYFQYK